MLSHPAIIRRAVLVCATLAAIGAAAGPSRAQSADVALFKVVTVKDEILVGMPRAELASLGGDAGAIARTLVGRGAMTLTRFAIRKSATGDLEIAPSSEIAILAHASIRIEPYAASLNVVASH
jgi:hypothetical protein